MKKWALLSVAAAAVVIGCGGGGNNGNGSTGDTTSGIPGTNLGINLTTPADANGVVYGNVNFLYLTGQGRAPDDLVAVVRNITLEDQYGTIVNSGTGDTSFNLKSFEIGSSRVSIPFTGQNSRLFETYELAFSEFYLEGTPNTKLTPPDTSPSFDARIRAFPGRETSVPIFLDDSMFAASGSSVTFDRGNFESRNLTTPIGESQAVIRSFLGDYVGFDLSALPLAERPQLSTGDVAGKFFISGDNYAIGQEAFAGSFEVLTEDSQRFLGTFGPERFINNYTPGTYTLYQVDPSDIDGLAHIVSIQGSWKSTRRVLTNIGAFEMITFPTIKDNAHQEVVMATYDGNGNPTSLYFGFMNYDNGKFEVHPIRTIGDPTDFSGTLTGTIANFHNKNGAITGSPDSVRYGNFAFDSGVSLPTGFPNTGTFVVFRK